MPDPNPQTDAGAIITALHDIGAPNFRTLDESSRRIAILVRDNGVHKVHEIRKDVRQFSPAVHRIDDLIEHVNMLNLPRIYVGPSWRGTGSGIKAVSREAEDFNSAYMPLTLSDTLKKLIGNKLNYDDAIEFARDNDEAIPELFSNLSALNYESGMTVRVSHASRDAKGRSTVTVGDAKHQPREKFFAKLAPFLELTELEWQFDVRVSYSFADGNFNVSIRLPRIEQEMALLMQEIVRLVACKAEGHVSALVFLGYPGQ